MTRVIHIHAVAEFDVRTNQFYMGNYVVVLVVYINIFTNTCYITHLKIAFCLFNLGVHSFHNCRDVGMVLNKLCVWTGTSHRSVKRTGNEIKYKREVLKHELMSGDAK